MYVKMRRKPKNGGEYKKKVAVVLRVLVDISADFLSDFDSSFFFFFGLPPFSLFFGGGGVNAGILLFPISCSSQAQLCKKETQHLNKAEISLVHFRVSSSSFSVARPIHP